MSQNPTLRQRERDLYAAADELREEDIPELENSIEELEQRVAEQYDDPTEVPQEEHVKHQRLRNALEELHGTADTYEYYADEWTEDGECVFILEELNGDEWAKVLDTVQSVGGQEAQQTGQLPQGVGRVEALRYGVESVPEDCPPDPGVWPAPVVNELYENLNDITAPSGTDLGNSSLAEAMGRADMTIPTDDS